MIKYRNPDLMYKLGITHQFDALQRFAEENNFRCTTLKKGYILTVILSRWLLKEDAEKVEKAFAKKIKKTLWTDVQYNGITECRVLTAQEANTYVDNIKERFPLSKYGGQHKGKPGLIKLYFMKLEKIKTKQDRYDHSPIDY